MTENVRITIITMAIISVLGFILKKTGVTDKRTDKFLSVLLVNFITPALMIHTIVTQLTFSFFTDSYINIFIAMASMVINHEYLLQRYVRGPSFGYWNFRARGHSIFNALLCFQYRHFLDLRDL